MWSNKKSAETMISAPLRIALLVFVAVLISAGGTYEQRKEIQAAETQAYTGIGYGIIANEARYGLVESMGFNWMKINLSWNQVQGTRGGSFNWGAYDNAVDTARGRGFSILLRVDDSPQWASKSGEFNAPPVNDADLADFMFQVADHFRGRVQAYEIWNEPNITIEWGNQLPDPIKFGQMMKALYPRVKQADPNAIVVTGGLSTTGDGNGSTVYGDLLFIARLYDPNLDRDPSDGFRGYFDAIGSHPYGGPYHPERSPWEQPNIGTYFRRAQQHREMMEVWGQEDKEIWATEFGYLLDPSVDGLNCDLGPHFNLMKVSEQQQADYLVRAFQYAEANWPWMGPMFVMDLDLNMDVFRSECDPVRHFAILRPDGSPRPAYTALSQMHKATPKLVVSNSQMIFMFNPSDANTSSQLLQITNGGSGILSWGSNTTPQSSWLTVSPSSGHTPSVAAIQVNKAGLPHGWTNGAVTIISTAGDQTLAVRVYIGHVNRAYAPLIAR